MRYAMISLFALSFLACSGSAAPGAAGPPGPTGPQGPAGSGDAGPTGTQGETGSTGATGQTGATGATGTQGTAGAQGAPGQVGITWQGTWSATLSYFTGDGVMSSGSSYIATSNNTGSEPPSSNWSLLASVGATGSRGATGSTGVIGGTGATGAAGLVGATGGTGATGAQGIQGIAGSTGANGSMGIPGATGSTGTQGAAGLIWMGAWDPSVSYVVSAGVISGGSAYIAVSSNKGSQPPGAAWSLLASMGATGPQGIQGIQGIQGNQGPVGATGAQGIQGVSGATGAQGTTGIQGPTGVQGIQGLQGSTGPTGSQGSQGLQGATGATGAQAIGAVPTVFREAELYDTPSGNTGWSNPSQAFAPYSGSGTIGTCNTNQPLGYNFNIASAGYYELRADGLFGPDRGIVSFKIDGTSVGTFDFYSMAADASGVTQGGTFRLETVGSVLLTTGAHTMSMLVSGKDQWSTATCTDIDYWTLVPPHSSPASSNLLSITRYTTTSLSNSSTSWLPLPGLVATFSLAVPSWVQIHSSGPAGAGATSYACGFRLNIDGTGQGGVWGQSFIDTAGYTTYSIAQGFLMAAGQHTITTEMVGNGYNCITLVTGGDGMTIFAVPMVQ